MSAKWSKAAGARRAPTRAIRAKSSSLKVAPSSADQEDLLNKELIEVEAIHKAPRPALWSRSFGGVPTKPLPPLLLIDPKDVETNHRESGCGEPAASRRRQFRRSRRRGVARPRRNGFGLRTHRGRPALDVSAGAGDLLFWPGRGRSNGVTSLACAGG